MSRLHQGPMRELLSEITLGELEVGAMLPREVDLVERFGVSRGVIRECIRGLEERGVIQVTHGKGARVTAPEQWDVLDPEVLSALLASPEGDEIVAEALECRRLLEVEAAGRAAERADAETVEALSALADRLAAEARSAARSPTAAERYFRTDLDFHRAVVDAAGNRALARMSVPLHRALMTAARARGATTGLSRRVAEQRRIVAAIASGDPAAAREAMAQHLDGAARRLRRR